jgi:hypothetical protein
LSIIAFITDAAIVLRILQYLKLPADPPMLAPARYPEDFEQLDIEDIAPPSPPNTPLHDAAWPGSRGPPWS